MKQHKNDTVLLVDNTNLSAWEISPYVQVASAYEMPCQIVTMKCDPEVAFNRQVHGVPKKNYDHMVRNLEHRWLPPFWTTEEVNVA